VVHFQQREYVKVVLPSQSAAPEFLMPATAWWLAPPKPPSPIQAFNRMALATGGVVNAERGAHADYNGHRYEVAFNDHRGYWIAGYQWSGWNVVSRGAFEDCLQEAVDACLRGGIGSQVRVDLSNGVIDQEAAEALLTGYGLAPYDEAAQEAYEAQQPWQCRSYVTGHTRVANVCEAIQAVRQGVPLDLWLSAESVEDWRSKVATYRKSNLP
jgi:hypothetical protein